MAAKDDYRAANTVWLSGPEAAQRGLRPRQLVTALALLLMFLFTWPIDLAHAGLLPFQFPFGVYLFLGWGFVGAALAVTGLDLGRNAVVALLKRYLLWRVAGRWYLVAFLLPPGLMLGGVLLQTAFAQTPPGFNTAVARQLFGDEARLSLFILPFFLLDLIANGEEIGWRGTVLPRLQARYSALVSTLILGLVWGFWHLPKQLPDFNPVSFGWLMVHSIAFSVLLTWLYNNTGGSLLLVAICHATSNTAGVFLPVANDPASPAMGAYIVFVLLEVVVAVAVMILAGPARLSRTKAKQAQE